MEKLALLEHKKLIQKEIQGLREMAKCLAVWRAKQRQHNGQSDRRTRETSTLSNTVTKAAFVGLFAAE
jgi:hypothetical protein